MIQVPFELAESAKQQGLCIEPTWVWTYGEGCECGCKYMVLRGTTITHHCKTLKQVEKAIAAERRDLIEPRKKLEKWQQLTLM